MSRKVINPLNSIFRTHYLARLMIDMHMNFYHRYGGVSLYILCLILEKGFNVICCIS